MTKFPRPSRIYKVPWLAPYTQYYQWSIPLVVITLANYDIQQIKKELSPDLGNLAFGI